MNVVIQNPAHGPILGQVDFQAEIDALVGEIGWAVAGAGARGAALIGRILAQPGDTWR